MNVVKMVRAAPLGVALLLCVASASAQIYKWVDAKGVTHYSDTPPANKQAEVKQYDRAPAVLVALPFELARAARTSPVTLYTMAQCKACDDGRKLLKARGIPFSEKTVTTAADQAKVREAGSDGQMPLLLVGRSKLLGFQPEAWDAALSNASYPAKSMLPARYRHPEAVAAAPVVARPAPVAESEIDVARESITRPPKKNPDTPPGFRF